MHNHLQNKRGICGGEVARCFAMDKVGVFVFIHGFHGSHDASFGTLTTIGSGELIAETVIDG